MELPILFKYHYITLSLSFIYIYISISIYCIPITPVVYWHICHNHWYIDLESNVFAGITKCFLSPPDMRNMSSIWRPAVGRWKYLEQAIREAVFKKGLLYTWKNLFNLYCRHLPIDLDHLRGFGGMVVNLQLQCKMQSSAVVFPSWRFTDVQCLNRSLKATSHHTSNILRKCLNLCGSPVTRQNQNMSSDMLTPRHYSDLLSVRSLSDALLQPRLEQLLQTCSTSPGQPLRTGHHSWLQLSWPQMPEIWEGIPQPRR